MRKTAPSPPVPAQPCLDDIDFRAVHVRGGDFADMIHGIGNRLGDPVAGTDTPKPDDVPRTVGLGDEPYAFAHFVPQVLQRGEDTNISIF